MAHRSLPRKAACGPEEGSSGPHRCPHETLLLSFFSGFGNNGVSSCPGLCCVSKLCTLQMGTPIGKCVPLIIKKKNVCPDLKSHAAGWWSLKSTTPTLPTSVLLWRGQVHLGAYQHFPSMYQGQDTVGLSLPSLCLSRVFPPLANMIRGGLAGQGRHCRQSSSCKSPIL